ncbi:MAG: cbb3-type cytochrome c oxidase subunit I, partial [Chloroflexota bacterium]|nr:cbb3-type cytochrome c oxidase subunit I [Chloroflexota bacterium]
MISLRQAQDIISLGLVKGAVAGLIGAGVGMGLTAGVRLAMRLPAWDPGWAVTVGTLVGLLCYLWGLGAFRGWMRWVLAQPEKESREPTSGWTRYFSFDTNHKVIGVQYMVTSLLIMAIAGVYALMGRLEMAQPGMQFMGPGTYNSLVSLHGIMMLGAVLVGISGMMNYLVPLMIGARDMAFPRLNALSYWFIPPAVFLLILSLPAGGFDTGWTAYPPLSVRAPLGMQLMLLAFYLVGLSSIVGSINLIVTILRLRAPGMGLFRMPIFVWAAMATAFLQLTFTQFIGTAFLMVALERVMGMGFFDPDKGGNVILYQHLFWIYTHPAVYNFDQPGL